MEVVKRIKGIKEIEIEGNTDIEKVIDLLEMIAIARSYTRKYKYEWITDQLDQISTYQIHGHNDMPFEIVAETINLDLA